ncbi:hypothetical protein Pla175_15270 [Pirellulimonas nuda]|uniref:Uncharacterized protein n=1 Tax=Pirellulimonas nuda TaxID=2528009 RepID=A0A518D9Q1_9BACT|nr:hypothetical protein [Pirellulimonas nuda]QDU88156.1 hypothetical protein Pla175_15270 [Pirellulimonas nuda]
MKLPGIHISLPVIFVLWCGGAYLAGMTPLLLYPAMWMAVGLVFLALGAVLKGKPAAPAKSQQGT